MTRAPQEFAGRLVYQAANGRVWVIERRKGNSGDRHWHADTVNAPEKLHTVSASAMGLLMNIDKYNK